MDGLVQIQVPPATDHGPAAPQGIGEDVVQLFICSSLEISHNNEKFFTPN